MDKAETNIEMAQRHIKQGEKHVFRQREIVASLGDDSRLIEIARRLLADMENLLAMHRDHLAYFESKAGHVAPSRAS